MRFFLSLLFAFSLILLPTPLLASTALTAGVVLHALMPAGVILIIYMVALQDLP